jgi:WbqC-like protein family
MTLEVEIQYFAPISVYKILYNCSHIEFNIYERHKKTSFRNRTLIAGSNGVIALSVPLVGGRDQKISPRDIRIDNSKSWRSRHWKSIQSAYNRSPWFEHYQPEIAELYRKRFDFLLDWNLACFAWMADKLELPLEMGFSEPSKFSGIPKERLVLTDQVLPKNFQNFSAVRYRQVFEDKLGFLPNLSILDLLFCEGKAACKLLA